MGLLGAPASFQRLMEKVVKDIHNTQVYIEDLLCHSADHPEHLDHLDQALARLMLTRKDCRWKVGDLPAKALKAFRELQRALTTEPILAYPGRGRQYMLTTDASVGDDEHTGGLGAILSQIDEEGNHLAIGYASRKLTNFEKNYTPFLLETQGALWGIEHFQYYLNGRPFLLFTDHKPLTGWDCPNPGTNCPMLLLVRNGCRHPKTSAGVPPLPGQEVPTSRRASHAADSLGSEYRATAKGPCRSVWATQDREQQEVHPLHDRRLHKVCRDCGHPQQGVLNGGYSHF